MFSNSRTEVFDLNEIDLLRDFITLTALFHSTFQEITLIIMYRIACRALESFLHRDQLENKKQGPNKIGFSLFTKTSKVGDVRAFGF